jgi:NitT/TauT family transport system ATP-binding protein
MGNLPQVALEDVTITFRQGAGTLVALDGVSASVAAGEFVSIIGPSGCGKSTLLRIVGGLLSPTRGRVSLGGLPPREAQRRKEIGFVFQDASLLPWRTSLANVHLPLEVNGRSANGRLDPGDLIDLVGLGRFRDYYPHQLSGGMQQRVALARALVTDPPILLMDEPFGALDEITRSSLRYELLRIWSANSVRRPTTVLFVTHSITEAVLLADRVIVLSAQPGRVLEVLDIDLPRPREEEVELTPRFLEYARHLRGLLRRAAA